MYKYLSVRLTVDLDTPIVIGPLEEGRAVISSEVVRYDPVALGPAPALWVAWFAAGEVAHDLYTVGQCFVQGQDQAAEHYRWVAESYRREASIAHRASVSL